MRPWAVWLAGVGVVAICALTARAIPDSEPGGELAFAELQKADLLAMDPANPANGPFPGPPGDLSAEQLRALESVLEIAQSGALTRVVSVEKSTYAKAMCGFFHQPSIDDVWVVWLEGPFRFVPRPMPSGVEMKVPWLPHHFERQVFIVNAADYTSLQRLVEWPLEDCPAE